MDSKKFTASEKHFKEKEIKLIQRIKTCEASVEDIGKVNLLLTEEITQLKKENEKLNSLYIKLLEYSKMTDDDIKAAIKKDKVVASFFILSAALNGGT